MHGGGLLAYFGYPQANEDAARRAVQAAMAITCEAVNGIEIRISVHTGIVITDGESAMPDMAGKTSKVAIQLCQSAARNEVTISQDTHGIVSGYFDCISLGVQHLSRLAQPVELFKVLRESGARTRLDAATAQLTPLVGRKSEITQLMRLWAKAVQGKHQIVLIQGEAGLGKSRLLHTLKERLSGQQHAIRELRCFPEFSQSPFHPLIATLEIIFGFAHGDTPEVKSAKLAHYLEAHYPLSVQDAVPLLTNLLSLPLSAPYQSHAGLSPQQQKEQTIAMLLDLLHALAWQQPVLFIAEDLHWIDPSTLELLKLFTERRGQGPVLAVFTARPEFDPPWSESLETTLPLTPLIGDEVAQMITSINQEIPPTILRLIVERADGVPLFAEEIAKLATQEKHASIPPGIPATLHDLLAARMDKLGKAKYTAQLAATIGREFGLDLLRSVSHAPLSRYRIA